MFHPARVRSLAPTDTTFTPPAGFRIDEYLRNSFGVLRGREGESHRVRLRFTGEAAKYVAERTWHPSQVLERPRNGEVVVGFELGHLREVEKWALSWGADCEVLEPDELRDRVVRAVTSAAARYAGSKGPAPEPRASRRAPGAPKARRSGRVRPREELPGR
jgi:predicted DNA-binding transcriptional regulator YafY